jgi:uncharacterized protein YjbJ (UPF0337 family)
MLTDELAATKDNWSGSVKTKWGTISGSSKLADTKDNWSGSVKTKWGTISGSSKLADNSLTCDADGNCMLRDMLAKKGCSAKCGSASECASGFCCPRMKICMNKNTKSTANNCA